MTGCLSWCVRHTDEEKQTIPDATSAPSGLEYTKASAEQTMEFLAEAASFVPFPFVKETINVALAVLRACEGATEVEQSVRELQKRIDDLMTIILGHLAPRDEDVDDSRIRKAAEEIQKDVQDLQRTLSSIVTDLDQIKDQNRLILFFFRDLNKSKVTRCMNNLAATLEKFGFSQAMQDANARVDILHRLKKMQDLAQLMVDEVHVVHEEVHGANKKLDSIGEKFDLLLANPTAHTTPNALARQRMPSQPIVFHGRDSLVQEIAQLLCNNSTHVCVLGPGGMGKTSLSLAVIKSANIQAKYGDRCFWVPCVEAKTPTQFLELLYNYLRVSGSGDDKLNAIVSELKKSESPRLILLDNFETPWRPVEGLQKDVGDILRCLSLVNHVAIFVTMRANDPPCDDIEWQTRRLGVVDKESARAIFCDTYPKLRENPDVESLDRLLDAVGCMPFAVVLLAKLGKTCRTSAKDLLAEWLKGGIEVIHHSNTPEDDIYRSISLSVNHFSIQENQHAMLLLETLSLLPAGTSKANLPLWAPNLKLVLPAISALSNAALLTNDDLHSEESGDLFVLPVIQSFMSSTKLIQESTRRSVQDACRQYVLDHGRRYYEPDFSLHSKALTAEDTNIQSILLSLEANESTIEVHLRFAWYRLDTRPSVEIAQRTVDLAKSLGTDHYIAEALCILGYTYAGVSRFAKAEQCLTEAYQLLDKLPGDPVVLRISAECIWYLSNVRMFCSNPLEPTLSFLHNAQPRFSDDLDNAFILLATGFCYFWHNLCLEAMDPLREAIDMFMRVEDPLDAAFSFLVMARNYRNLSQLPQALACIQEASDILQVVNHARTQSVVDFWYGCILISLDRHAEALPKLESSLSACQHLGDLDMVAVALMEIGYIYMGKDDYKSAFVAYESARKVYDELGPGSREKWLMEECRENLQRIKEKEMNPKAQISLLRRIS